MKARIPFAPLRLRENVREASRKVAKTQREGTKQTVDKSSKAAPAPDPAVEPEEPLLRSFDRWWFGYGSPTSLGLFRIALGAIILLNLLMLAGDWGDWFGENGYMPGWLGTITFGPRFDTGLGFQATRITLLAGVTNPTIAYGFFLLTMVFAVLTSVGLFTRVSAFLLALFLVSLHHRDTSILHGGDTVMRIGAIYLAVSPCGRACSLDRLWRLRRGGEDGPVEVPLYGQRLVQFNLALIYFTTVWAKWFGSKWMNGTATWYPARLPEFYRFPVPGLFNDFPFVYLTTYGTILVEFSLATLVFFRPLRKYVLLAGVLLHGFIEYSMNIPLFSFLMISAYVTHYQGEEIAAFCRRLGDRLRPLIGLEVTLPPGRRLSATGERFLSAVDPFGFVRYLPARGEGPHDATIQAHLDRDLGWDAKKDDGKRANPFRGVAYRSPGAWLFMLIPGVWRRMQTGCLEAA